MICQSGYVIIHSYLGIARLVLCTLFLRFIINLHDIHSLIYSIVIEFLSNLYAEYTIICNIFQDSNSFIAMDALDFADESPQ